MQEVQDISNDMNEIRQLFDTNLINKPEWGNLNFRETEEELWLIMNLIQELKLYPLEQLPNKALKNLRAKVAEVKALFIRLDEYNIQQENHISIRNQLILDIKNVADGFHTQSIQWLPYLAYKQGDLQHAISEISSSLSDAKQLLMNTKHDTEQRIQEINEIVSKARDASAKVGVVAYTKDFAKEAEDLSRSSKIWLLMTILLALATLSLAYHSWRNTDIPINSSFELIYRLGSKFALMAILFTATIWTGRIFKALRHQSSINKHRALSLQTFQSFTNAANDETTKNAVLLEATKSIFGMTSTGYLDQRDDSSESSVKIIEIFKSMLGPKN